MRKICFVTGSRAEYGLLRWLIGDVDDDPELVLQLVVTGSHLSRRFGHTVDDIVADGFEIDERVPMDLDDDTSFAAARATGECMSALADTFDRLQPDLLVVLGDRFEILAAASAALLVRLPLAHISGGETTEGAMDEAIRHAITKMAHLHFPAAEEYRRRIIQLGEQPDKIHTVGALALDNIERLDLLDRTALSKAIGLDDRAPFFLITYHPVTLSAGHPAAGVNPLLEALETFSDHWLIFTGVNADPGNDSVTKAIHEFANRHKERTVVAASLGQTRYLSAMSHAAAVIGNSSSGIVEAPALCIPTVNTGDRQRGRMRAASVIDCDERADEIVDAIRTAISASFRAGFQDAAYPFGKPGATGRILEILKRTPLDNLLMKRFNDLSFC